MRKLVEAVGKRKVVWGGGAGAAVVAVISAVLIYVGLSGAGGPAAAEPEPTATATATSTRTPTATATVSPTPTPHSGILNGARMTDEEWEARKDLLEGMDTLVRHAGALGPLQADGEIGSAVLILISGAGGEVAAELRDVALHLLRGAAADGDHGYHRGDADHDDGPPHTPLRSRARAHGELSNLDVPEEKSSGPRRMFRRLG